ncbi:MAG: diphosphomevalonate decarboxylase [Candidatus Thorarchaeota archaeon]
MKSSAIAHSNIALIKYWGHWNKVSPQLNIPSNDSVSMTKYGLSENTHLQTHTTIEFSKDLIENEAILNNNLLKGRDLERILKIIKPLKKISETDYNFKMVSFNDFPTQAGLASSAAGFAALTIAAAKALNLDLSQKELSTFARLGSGSAARSIHGGFVYWYRGSSHETSYAEQICSPDHFAINAVIAIIDEGRKEVTSELGHELAKTSIFNATRVKKSHEQAKEIKKAILEDDFKKVGMITEKNSLYMHAVMMTSEPALFYWNPLTLEVIKKVLNMRKYEKIDCFFTIDAGPNVHCFSRPENSEYIQEMLLSIEGIEKTILVKPAGDSYTTNEHLF